MGYLNVSWFKPLRSTRSGDRPTRKVCTIVWQYCMSSSDSSPFQSRGLQGIVYNIEIEKGSLKFVGQAYVGGLYKEQGMEIVNSWLFSLFKLFIHQEYDHIRSEHLIPT
jgi:hypothetical protein